MDSVAILVVCICVVLLAGLALNFMHISPAWRIVGYIPLATGARSILFWRLLIRR